MEAQVTFDDVSDADNAYAAAVRTYGALQDLAEQIGSDPDSIILHNPEVSEDCGHGSAWTVVWEDLYDWTMALTGGESAVSRELGRYGGEPEVAGLFRADNFVAEPYNGYVLAFYDA
jgi:hypothetical protein